MWEKNKIEGLAGYPTHTIDQPLQFAIRVNRKGFVLKASQQSEHTTWFFSKSPIVGKRGWLHTYLAETTAFCAQLLRE